MVVRPARRKKSVWGEDFRKESAAKREEDTGDWIENKALIVNVIVMLKDLDV